MTIILILPGKRSAYFLLNKNLYNIFIFIDFLCRKINDFYTNGQIIIDIYLNNNLFKAKKQCVYGTLFFGGLNDR